MYKIDYDVDIEKVFKKMPKRDVEAIRDKIKEVAKSPRMLGAIKLRGRDAYRVRAGDYRIIYSIQDRELLVLVIQIDNRGAIYKKR